MQYKFKSPFKLGAEVYLNAHDLVQKYESPVILGHVRNVSFTRRGMYVMCKEKKLDTFNRIYRYGDTAFKKPDMKIHPEDMLEDTQIFESPIRWDDIVYVLSKPIGTKASLKDASKWIIYEEVVRRVVFGNYNRIKVQLACNNDLSDFNRTFLIGKTCFLDKERARIALEKAKEEYIKNIEVGK